MSDTVSIMPRPAKPRHQWTLNELCPGVIAHANTAGEARAAFKRYLGLDRLPAGMRPQLLKPTKEAKAS